jgi:hypothetical protein
VAMNWLIKKLVDSGWVRLGLAFRWIFGTKELFTKLVNESDLKIIESRYKLIEQSGFFSGEDGATNQQAFIQALFAYDAWKADAFSKALDFSYSWDGGSVAPLEAFLNFIRRIFFQGSSTESNKQTFIDAVLTQNNGESNALSNAAWAKAPKAELNPLTIVLNSLTEAGCFTSVENKQKVINGICTPNEKGKNALCNALESRDSNKPKNEDVCPNIKILLNALVKADCFNSPSSESNKKTFIQAVLATGEYGGVLSEAMWNPNALEQILTALTEAGCFTNENGIQAFINALITTNSLGRNPLSYAAHIPDSLRLIYKQLKQIGCFKNAENKQKIINAIFSPDNNGNSTLLNASSNKECSTLILNILTKASCFEGSMGSANQQAFVRAAIAANKYGHTCLFNSLNDKQILKQLMEVKYFEGPFAEQNKQAFIKAVLAPTKIGEDQQESALSRNCIYSTFPLLLEHLTTAGCFSGASLNSNKKAFINAVFAKDEHGESMLSAIYRDDSIILLLKKLGEAGCFNNAEYKKQFRQAVRANGNVILFHVIRNDLRSYLALHKSLLLAGFSAQDIKALLNEPIKQNYDSWAEATPLMMALRSKNDLLAAQLIADGAELTEQQKQQVKAYTKKQQKAENEVVPLDREAIKKELTQPKSVLRRQSKLERRGSLSELSLFSEKQSDTTSKYAMDDIALGRMASH